MFAFGANNSNYNDSLESGLFYSKFGGDLGYNLIDKGVTISPYFGFRIYNFTHTVYLKSKNVSIGQLINHPDLVLNAEQISSVLGLNINLSVYHEWFISANLGYIFNMNKHAALTSAKSEVNNYNQSIIKNLYFGFNFGKGFTIDKSYQIQCIDD